MQPRSAWCFFPWAIIGGMLLVIAVNAGMAWSALRTFPGTAVEDTFDHSNDYDKVLNAAAHEAALGWSLQVALERGRSVATLTDRDGRPIEGARVVATAQRPVGAEAAVEVAFRAGAPGRYTAAALPTPGQWDLLFSASVGDRHLHATRRIVVP